MRSLLLAALLLCFTSTASAADALRVHEVGEGDAVVILLHGWGARGDDLVPLARRLAKDRPVRFVMPQAPRAREGGGRAWFDPRAGQETAAQVAFARARLVELVKRIEAQGVPRSRIVVAGFSQGAIMSLDLAIHGTQVAGVGVLSGTRLPIWGSLTAMKGTPVLVTHGEADRVLPFDAAQKLAEELVAAGARVTWRPFDGGHRIPPAVVAALDAFIAETLTKKK